MNRSVRFGRWYKYDHWHRPTVLTWGRYTCIVTLEPVLDADAVDTFTLSDHRLEMLEAVETCIVHGRNAGEFLIGPRQKFILRVSGLPQGLPINDSSDSGVVDDNMTTPYDKTFGGEDYRKRSVTQGSK